eukprot:6488917-Amphidinium_carterae.2
MCNWSVQPANSGASARDSTASPAAPSTAASSAAGTCCLSRRCWHGSDCVAPTLESTCSGHSIRCAARFASDVHPEMRPLAGNSSSTMSMQDPLRPANLLSFHLPLNLHFSQAQPRHLKHQGVLCIIKRYNLHITSINHGRSHASHATVMHEKHVFKFS